MRKSEFPVVQDIILLGGGHAHVSVLRNFGMFPINGARLTLISPEVDTPYSGMLPGLIAGHYTFDEAHIDLGPLARFAGARFFKTAAERIDPAARLIYCTDGRPPVPYDVLSINTGSTPVFDSELTLERDVIPVKPVSQFLKQWEALKERVAKDRDRRIGIVGAGAGGIELLLSMQYALAKEVGSQTPDGPGQYHVFTRDSAILKTHGTKVRETMHEALATREVTVHTNFNVAAVDDHGVSDGRRMVPIDDIIWVTGAEPPTWFKTSGLDVDNRGFVAVDQYLRSTSHPDIFGAGDAVAFVSDPRPKSGVFAVRQGPILAHNLRASVLEQPLKRYRPQRAFLSLISTGDKFAVASRSGLSVKGEWVWRWKDHIDRSFMKKFNELPSMDQSTSYTIPTVANLPPEIADNLAPGAMRCGGCGAKVGSATLSGALRQIDGLNAKPSAASNIILGIGDDAAAIQVPEGKLLVQTVDSFPAMIDDPYVFGQITANHCLGDIYAMAARPHSTLAIVTLPFSTNAKREADLVQLLAGAKSVLDKAGCTIVGGHTAEGTELAFGFSVNGFADRNAITRKGGMTPGLSLIVTKAIGTGALFAAHGRGRAKGRWIGTAIEGALQSNAVAAEILRSHGARAMTDVTGFGLVGHLGEMLQSSNASAALHLADVPFLTGAPEVVDNGIVSSLQRDNLVWRADIDTAQHISERPEFQLLFDPQTAGGLLAGIPSDHADSAITALRDAGYRQAAVIGETIPSDPVGPRIKLN